MTLSTYPDGTPFNGVIGTTPASSSPSWPVPPAPPEGAPNVVVILLDDLGFAQLGCYGGLGGRIRTPHIDRLAAEGLRYQNFHTTALCSPTRAALLTGRNHHSVGVAAVMERSTGYPGYNGRIPKDCAMLPAVLRDAGYSTMAVGKWHLTPDEQTTPAGPFDRWPLAQGFERFYGFLAGLTSQWHPELVEDNHVTDAPATPEEGYHLSADLVDHAIRWIAERKAVRPSKPFFTYLAFGAPHSPHHVATAYSDAYRGMFDAGWDVIRAETLARQKELGLMPASVTVPPRNPGVEAWDDLPEEKKRIFARQMEVFAGFVTHTDEQIGRLLTYLDESGLRDDTLVVFLSDNGASSEGGPNGFINEMWFLNGEAAAVDDMLPHLDDWGLPGTHPHYATGWAMAGNTPNRMYKSFVHEGGTRDPMIVSWPGRIADRGAIRTQFHHVTDVTPTILEAIGLDWPDRVAGHDQRPLEGTSFAYTFDQPDAPTRKTEQYFEMFAHRAIYAGGWKAVALHWSSGVLRRIGFVDTEVHDGDPDADRWELYHLDEDPAEQHDLAADEPERLAALVDLWHSHAHRYQVFPLDDTMLERVFAERPRIVEWRDHYRFHHRVRLPRSGSPDVRNRSFRLTASITVPDGGAEGVIAAQGGESGGYSLCLVDGRLHYVTNHLERAHYVASSADPIAPGRHTVVVEFAGDGMLGGEARLVVDGEEAGRVAVAGTNPITYAIAEGFEVGSDSVTPVWPRYRSPFTFTGTIHQVDLEVLSEAPPMDTKDAVLQVRADLAIQ
ncbi:MAG: arylsulfatase [Actinomycetota bacterium]|nr:arylsulfatase [Actinomycetota bacterium]